MCVQQAFARVYKQSRLSIAAGDLSAVIGLPLPIHNKKSVVVLSYL
jgi:hypothetical protein